MVNEKSILRSRCGRSRGLSVKFRDIDSSLQTVVGKPADKEKKKKKKEYVLEFLTFSRTRRKAQRNFEECWFAPVANRKGKRENQPNPCGIH